MRPGGQRHWQFVNSVLNTVRPFRCRPTVHTVPFTLTPAQAADRASWVHAVDTDDIDVLAASQPNWTLQYEQLSGGPFSGHIRHIQLPGVRLVFESATQSTRQRGQIGAEDFGFAMALDLPGEAIFNGQRLDPNTIMVGRGDKLDLCTPPGFSLIAVVVSAGLLQPLWERMYQKPLAAWLDQQIVLAAQPEAARALQRLHLDTMRRAALMGTTDLGSPPCMQLRDDILIEWIEALPPQVDTSELGSVAARKQIVDRACEIMMSEPSETLSMLELCRRVGAGRRKLSYCFQDVLGTSPAKYLRAARLNGVRRELKASRNPALRVQDVASRWGFEHLSQFSQDYKRLFGELPSQTLRQS